MIHKKKITLLTISLTTLLLISGCSEQDSDRGIDENDNSIINENSTLYVGGTFGEFPTIQEAINNANNNATIFVKQGSYNELITINKTIILKGEDKNTTILTFNPDSDITSQESIITVNTDHCIIENLQITITNKSHFIDVQIQEGGCCGEPDVVHTKLFIPNGISINSNYNIIKNTIITNVSEAIKLLPDSASNMIQQNQIKNNQIGIEILDSENNTISDNSFLQNQQQHLYLSTDSDFNTISNNIMNNSTYGVRIKGSRFNIVVNNWITYTDIGIYFCCDSHSNHFYLNILNHNYQHAHEDAGLYNIWTDDITETGNYWENYHGVDENKDGVGETPYTITDSGNQDIYPLMNPPLNILANP